MSAAVATDLDADRRADAAFMREALQFARLARYRGEVPVGAVLVDADGAVVAQASNASVGTNDPTAHAEVVALRAAGRRRGNYRLPGTTLYVTLEPCPMCAVALVHARVARVVFAAADPRTGACGSVFDLVRARELNHRLEVTGGVLAGDSAGLLRDFFEERR